MHLLLRTNLELAKTSIKERRGRTLLTCLGIAIGIASIILILSLMGSVSRLINSEIQTTGKNLVIIRPTTEKTTNNNIIETLTSLNNFNKSNLSPEDIDTIKAIDNEQIKHVAPISVSKNTLIAEKTVESATILATNPDLEKILSLNLSSGNFIENNSLKTAVIGRTLSLKLFGTTEPIAKTFSLHGEKFIIVGILSEFNNPLNFNGVDLDNAIITNINQYKNIEKNLQIQQINVELSKKDFEEPISIKIKNILKETKNGDTTFDVLYGDKLTHPANSLLDIATGILSLISSIALLVGGIGVMNIMLVSVAERTHEIGIRKAIGATNLNIFMQFLFESLILCIVGGISGIILGYALAFLISVITPFAPYISLKICLTAIFAALLSGTIFGLYPAIKAAKKPPIDSLKHYE